MQILRYVLRNITPLNVILLVILAISAGAIYPSFRRSVIFDYQRPERSSPPGKEQISSHSLPDLSDYSVVGELNIFHPDRKPPPVEEKLEPVQAPLQKVEFTLYGTLVSDDVTIAFVEERGFSRRATGKRKKISILKVGDTLAGYTLKSIEDDRIIMVRGKEEVTVLLSNPGAASDREVRPKQRLPATRGRTGR